MAVRIVLAVAALVSAAVHLWLYVGYEPLDVVGVAFLVNAVSGAVLAALLVLWRHRLPLLLAVLFGAATLLAFVVATTPVGLLGVHETWSGGPQQLAAASEAVLIVLGAWGLRGRGVAGAPRQPRDYRVTR